MTTTSIKDTEYNLKVAIAFLKAYPNAKLFPAVWNNKHIPQLPWSRRATGDASILKKWAKFFIRHQILPKKRGRRNKPETIITKRPRTVYFCIAAERSGFQIVDIDDKNGKDGNESLKNLQELPRTLTSSTPSGNGRHMIYYGGPIKCKANSLGEGVDTVVMVPVPGMRAGRKGQYKIIDKTKACCAPDWIKQMAGDANEKPDRTASVAPVELDLPHNIEIAKNYLRDEAKRPSEGERDTTTYQVACKVRDFAVSEDQCHILMTEVWLPLCEESGDWTDSDIAAKIDSAYRNALSPVGSATAEFAFGVQQEVEKEVEEGEESIEDLIGKAPRFKYVTSKGAPKNRIENLKAIMAAHAIKIRYNEMAKTVEFDTPILKNRNRDHVGEVVLAELEDLAVNYNMPTGSIHRYTKHIASLNSFHPVRDWLAGVKWDGTTRIQALMDTITTTRDFDTDLKETILKRWLTSCIAALYEPIFSTRGVLVLQGDQYLGKTSWGRSLCPPEAFLEGASLDPKNKDSVMSVVSRWIVELGELDATFRQADLARLKAFISNREDVLRVPYATTNSNFPRRTVFMASVNPSTFLRDPTGNSRWWTIPCIKLNFNHGINMRQLWAEVKETLYEQDYSWHFDFSDNVVLNESNKLFEEDDPMEVAIHEVFATDADKARWTIPLTPAQICEQVGLNPFQRKNLIKMGKACRKVFEFKRTRRSTLYLTPPLKDSDELSEVFGKHQQPEECSLRQ